MRAHELGGVAYSIAPVSDLARVRQVHWTMLKPAPTPFSSTPSGQTAGSPVAVCGASDDDDYDNEGDDRGL